MSNQLIMGFVDEKFLSHLKAGECVNFSEVFFCGVFRAPCWVVRTRTLGHGSQESSDKANIPCIKEKSRYDEAETDMLDIIGDVGGEKAVPDNAI